MLHFQMKYQIGIIHRIVHKSINVDFYFRTIIESEVFKVLTMLKTFGQLDTYWMRRNKIS